MQAQLISNLAQHQRPHGEFAVAKKVFLPFNNGGADAQDGVKTLLDIFDKPACLLQALLHGLCVAALVLLHGIGVNVMHLQARHHVAVQRHLKAAAYLDDQDIGHDNIALNIGKAPAWFGV